MGGSVVSGIIYIHAISPERMRGSHKDGFEILQKLCGPDTYSRIFLATSWWNICEEKKGLQREGDLRKKIWVSVLDCPNSGHMSRLENSPTSAWELVKTILESVKWSGRNGEALRVQKQMVDERKKLQKTDVGQVVNLKGTKKADPWIMKLKQLMIH